MIIIRVIKLSRTKEDWAMWGEKFLARARRLGYRGGLVGTVNCPKDSDTIDESNEAGKKLKKVREANDYTFE